MLNLPPLASWALMLASLIVIAYCVRALFYSDRSVSHETERPMVWHDWSTVDEFEEEDYRRGLRVDISYNWDNDDDEVSGNQESTHG